MIASKYNKTFTKGWIPGLLEGFNDSDGNLLNKRLLGSFSR